MEMGPDKKPEPNEHHAFPAFFFAPMLSCFLLYAIEFWPFKSFQNFMNIFAWAVPTLVVVWAMIIVFAFPVYALLKKYKRLTPPNIIFVAGLIGLIPDLYFETYLSLFTHSEILYYGEQCQAVNDGVRTECGWQILFQMLAKHFALGCLAGYIFCAIYFKKLAVWKYRA